MPTKLVVLIEMILYELSPGERRPEDEVDGDFGSDRGKLSLRYNEAWRTAADVYPLSISMPLPLAEHGNAKIDP